MDVTIKDNKLRWFLARNKLSHNSDLYFINIIALSPSETNVLVELGSYSTHHTTDLVTSRKLIEVSKFHNEFEFIEWAGDLMNSIKIKQITCSF